MSGAPRLRDILSAADSVALCRCAPVLTPAYAFRLDRIRQSFEIEWGRRAPAPVGATSRSALERDLTDLLVLRGWDFALLRSLDASGRLLFVAKHHAVPQLFYGIAVDSVVVSDQVFRPCLERRAELTEGLARFSLAPASVFLEVALRGGTVLLNSHRDVRPEKTVELSLPNVFGELRLTAGLLEQHAELVAGTSIAESPVPLALLLASLGAAALLGVWWSMRRSVQLAATRAALVSGVSHELRTPLTQILLYGELIQRGRAPGEGGPEGAAQVIVRESRRLLRLIGNALQLAIGKETTALRRDRVLLGDLLGSAIEDYHLLAAERRVAMELSLEGDPAVIGDADGIRQIVINLLDNAVRHGPEGQTVVVGVTRHGGAIELYVRDQGPGIPVEWRGRVWEAFVRAPAAGGTGSGMGLAVVQRLAERYGGTAGIRDAEGGGAVVFVRLPVAGG